MKKILFPTDFSNLSKEIFKYATELAYYFKSRIVIMHSLVQSKEIRLSDNKLEKMADETSTRLFQFVSMNLPEDYKDIKVDYVVKIGQPASAILDTILDEGINLVVLGMTSKVNALQKLIGKTSLEVVDKADCPVLIIPANAHLDGIDNIVFTTNFEFRDFGAIHYLKKWSQTLHATIHCLHIVEENESEWSAVKNLNILKAVYYRHKRILFNLKTGEFQNGIEVFAKNKRADIIAMMSHKRNLVSRLIKKNEVLGVVKRMPIPILIIKDNAYEVDSAFTEWIEIANSIA